jgi:hypothetical protein
MATLETAPGQVKLAQCSILSPTLEHRAVTAPQAEKFRIAGIDIRDAVQSVNIYESIFDNTISATIDIEESNGYPELFPLVGQEFVRLVFTVDYLGEVREFGRTFRIRRLGDQSFPLDAKRTYTLDLVTPEFFTSLSSRMMKRYDQTTCTEAVRDIMTNRLQIPADRRQRIEETDLRISAVIPNYTPLQAINFFTNLGLTQEKSESNFLFYETLDGFWFVSVASLIDPKVKSVATYEVNANKMTGHAKISEKDAYNSIIGLHQKQSFDVLVDVTTGLLRSKMLHLDFFARKWKEDDSRYTDTFKETTHLDEFPLYPDNFDQSVDRNVKLFIVPTNTSSAGSKYALSVGEQADENRLYQSVVLRNRQLRELHHLTTVLKVPGQPSVRAGSVIDLIYPTSRELQGDSVNSRAASVSGNTPYYSGRHLVTAVRHVLTQASPSRMEYTMHLEATRDSFGTKLVPYAVSEEDT